MRLTLCRADRASIREFSQPSRLQLLISAESLIKGRIVKEKSRGCFRVVLAVDQRLDKPDYHGAEVGRSWSSVRPDGALDR